jgi:hypothetical protein
MGGLIGEHARNEMRKSHVTYYNQPNVTGEWLAFLCRIREVLVSKLGTDQCCAVVAFYTRILDFLGLNLDRVTGHAV